MFREFRKKVVRSWDFSPNNLDLKFPTEHEWNPQAIGIKV